jgi:hypothetical protein
MIDACWNDSAVPRAARPAQPRDVSRLSIDGRRIHRPFNNDRRGTALSQQSSRSAGK